MPMRELTVATSTAAANIAHAQTLFLKGAPATGSASTGASLSMMVIGPLVAWLSCPITRYGPPKGTDEQGSTPAAPGELARTARLSRSSNQFGRRNSTHFEYDAYTNISVGWCPVRAVCRVARPAPRPTPRTCG